MGEAEHDRHLNRQGLEQYLATGAPSTVKIAGKPPVYLIIDPAPLRLSLRTPQSKNKLPDLSGYQNLSAEVVHWEGQQWCQLTISGPVIRDAFQVLYAIADRLQLDGAEFARATNAALEAFGELLSGVASLSDEQAIGLYGELVVFEHLLRRLPPEVAISAWRGSEAEEHDFDIGEADVEVKATTSETRRHWITSTSQLAPTQDRDLWLVSIQLTGAGTHGRSLSDLVSTIQGMLVDEACSAAFKNKLRLAGWRDEMAETTNRKMRLRTRPATFRVDATFPALTADRLGDLGIRDRIVQLRYLIDLSSVPPSTDAPELICELGA